MECRCCLIAVVVLLFGEVLSLSVAAEKGSFLSQSALSSHKYHARIPADTEAGRLLSHQQQSGILADIQEHHKLALQNSLGGDSQPKSEQVVKLPPTIKPTQDSHLISQHSFLIPQTSQLSNPNAFPRRGASANSELNNKTQQIHHSVYREEASSNYEDAIAQFGTKLKRKETSFRQQYAETASPSPPFSALYQKPFLISSTTAEPHRDFQDLLLSQGVRQQLFKQLEQDSQIDKQLLDRTVQLNSQFNSQNGQLNVGDETHVRQLQPHPNTLTQQQVPAKPQQNKQHLQEQLHKQFQQQLSQRQDLLRELKLAILNSGDLPARQDRTQKSADLPFALANFSSLLLANGQQVQAIQQSSLPTPKAQQVSFADISKGVLPPGADFKVIRHNNGGLEELGKLPPNLPNKKVTYVFLEEQKDGTFKVQGIKGNNNTDVPGGDVNSIIKKLQEGNLKLPPQSLNIADKTEESIVSPSYITPSKSTTARPQDVFYQSTNHLLPNRNPTQHTLYKSSGSQTGAGTEVQFVQSITVPSVSQAIQHATTPSNSDYYRNPNDSVFQNQRPDTNNKPYSTDVKLAKKSAAIQSTSTSNNVVYNQFAPTKSENSDFKPYQQQPSFLPTIQTWSETPKVSKPVATPSVLPTLRTAEDHRPVQRVAYPKAPTSYQQFDLTSSRDPPTTTNTFYNSKKATPTKQSFYNEEQEDSDDPSTTLHEIFRKEGLFAMAKFLKESGLNNILNNTGPYTMFAPTDKAFRALLVQLGGPEKAADKFRDNPRLLSGLLLHHIIPGAFTLSSLQDEMTGVSLAGTQLRVNVYPVQDDQWNDVRVVTINGARVVGDKKDIPLPHGIAHAVDRVMFPLPVGDLISTLQSDRARRFTKLLRAMDTAGLGETLTSSPSLTLFAPTDDAFSVMAPEDAERLLTDPEMARALVLRHVAPGTLYSAGMRYYQERHSMVDGQPITLYKNGGNIKVNTASVVTFNTPTTNGVVHAINGLL